MPASPTPVFMTIGLAAYVFVEPLVRGAVVLDLGPGHDQGPKRLEDMGARRVVAPVTLAEVREVPDESVDVVLCLAAEARGEAPDDEAGDALVDELDRVLRSGGYVVARVEGQGALPDFARRLAARFPEQAAVGERVFTGVAFSVADVEDMAVNGDVAGGQPTEDAPVALLFAARDGTRPWALTESLLVPLGGVGFSAQTEGEGEPAALRARLAAAEARVREGASERDALREALLVLRDEADRHREEAAAMRREAQRFAREGAAAAAEREVAALERARAERRAASAERELLEAVARFRRRDVEAGGLEREVARLRAKATETPRNS